jgi:flavin reductase (DIM6/NTAB) family NADH-FMN oxidoreductase RutF
LSRPPPDPNSLTPVSALVFRETCAHFATGVAVATACASDGSPHGLTISTFTPVSLDPPLVLFCLDFTSSTHATFRTSPVFAINILTEQQKQFSVGFAALPEGRFDDLAWYPGETGAPLLPDSLAWLECWVVNRMEAGDHTILVGQVVTAGSRSGTPLVHFYRDYHVLA